jgi:hypothetical protein
MLVLSFALYLSETVFDTYGTTYYYFPKTTPVEIYINSALEQGNYPISVCLFSTGCQIILFILYSDSMRFLKIPSFY